MLAPKKGLLCNLNHIHLQHISLGLHLSRHPELQETSGSMGGGDQSGCPENCEQVDANSNNPSLKCRCCESHPQQAVTLGLQNQTAQEDFPCLHAGEEVASPCDLASSSSSSSSSSSVSSCSDFSLDDSPVSVYCKGFPREEPQPLEDPPSVAPTEDTQDAQALGDEGGTCDGSDANLTPPVPQRPASLSGRSPDSLRSSSSLDSRCDETSPSVRDGTGIGTDLDPNCNPLPEADAAPPAPPVPGSRDPALSRAPELRPRPGSVPPPVPPRPRRRLQVLNGRRAEQPPLPVRPLELEPGSGELCRDVGKKTITSFHELAQKRKRNGAGAAPAQPRTDRSDWLIIFSPDTELPPPNELLCSTRAQDPARPQLRPEPPPRPPCSRQREVTTFKELRYRSASSKAKGPAVGEHPPALPEGAPGSGSAGWVQPVPLGGQALAPMDGHDPKRRRPRPGPQPGDAEEAEPSALPAGKGAAGRRLRGPGGAQREAGAEESGAGSRRHAEAPPAAAGAAAGAAAAPGPPGAGSTEGTRGEQKKALLVAISAAVDKVIAHFSSARNLVQKAQLGDSRLSPDVGYLLLHTLCPALYALVEDGLKPFQKDVITGQRRNSPWSVVEASVRTGPGARSFHSLCGHVAGLAPLHSTRQKFHAFILGLLNIKQLEQWISHLQKSPGVISVLYSPTAFFALSQGPLPYLADELLLLIQPLSVLTFHLDLLFEHHHLSMDVRPLVRRPQSPPGAAHGSAVGPGSEGGLCSSAGGSLEDQRPPDAVGSAGGSPRLQPHIALVPGAQVGAALQQTLQHVLRWGGRLSRTLLGTDGSPEPRRPEPGPGDAGAGAGGWWAQLGRDSRPCSVPSKEKLPSVWWTKLRAAAADPSPDPALREPSGAELRLLPTRAVPELPAPQPGSSSAGTSGSSSPEALILPVGAGASPGPCGADGGRWLGRLFGASSPSTRTPSPDAASAGSRRPSRWLSPGARVLAAVVKGLAAEKSHAQEQAEGTGSDSPQPCRAVRALCDHTGTADGHLSFQKGDILQLLSTVDEDWIRCCHGNSTGLVPVGYTSLIL
ncbi:AP-4 complex accessory subunit RUSC1 [Melopsittacus undulatus]|uniref:AP-4 complex accessory subunit RUSC1 n=1 Tax=Melopsittacus undulatus TaxID=13146 RepID=UPI00146C6171|nr:RUN and SH3 domain-containing protein 1 [Melopsittacus undulatus]XP_033927140.1 RUN and SH3 domain-containing protein 1 [Melopsittacus undulatus]